MKLPFTAFYDAFPQHRVVIKLRPDGSLLLTLSDEAGKVIHRAIDSEVLYREDRVRQVIRELLREMKLEAGEAIWHGRGIDWVSCELPTYLGGPVHMTAAKTLVARRKLEAERRTPGR
ncbi:DUF3509 domain-containing protein [Pseudomonas sp. LFM046]|uniref:DUF3509 domain-containing protein n=1 Tax=Pseudomonas sp. LFM046 TaxID=1608357 RepID=UPI0005CF99EB|nr:DUF3509 domain-containing protein [Pseudomonas sp. LFM046]